jgi:hypothetical protein
MIALSSARRAKAAANVGDPAEKNLLCLSIVAPAARLCGEASALGDAATEKRSPK